MLYVGIEYEIRFVTSNFDNLKLIMDSFDKLDFFNRSVRIENDFYFECLTKNNSDLKYCINNYDTNNLGRLEFKKRICTLGNINISLEMGHDCMAYSIPIVMNRTPAFREYNNIFNLDKVTYLKQRRNSLVHVYEGSEIHASIDTLMSGRNKIIFVEFETSVPSPDSIENLKKISDDFKTLTKLNEYTGNKFDYLFSKDGDRT